MFNRFKNIRLLGATAFILGSIGRSSSQASLSGLRLTPLLVIDPKPQSDVSEQPSLDDKASQIQKRKAGVAEVIPPIQPSEFRCIDGKLRRQIEDFDRRLTANSELTPAQYKLLRKYGEKLTAAYDSESYLDAMAECYAGAGGSPVTDKDLLKTKELLEEAASCESMVQKSLRL